jgi:hypothetical protein
VSGPAGTAPEPGSLSGHVIAYEYYGHDSIIRVQPDSAAAGPALTVRTVSGPKLRLGAAVTIRARGPVIAWAR